MQSVSTLVLIVPMLFACRAEPESERPSAAPEPATAASAGPKGAEASPVSKDTVPAAVGKPAPDFTLPGLDGKSVTLSSFRGKTVVLEWYNPECPFVKKAHEKGSLVDAAKRLTEKTGVVWLAINSGAPGKQGAGREKNLAGKRAMSLNHPILL